MVKWYVKIRFNTGNHILIRVDNSNEFKDLIFNNHSLINYFKLVIAKSLVTKIIPEPFKMMLIEEDYNKLLKNINGKLGVKKLISKELNLVQNSNCKTMIKIVCE